MSIREIGTQFVASLSESSRRHDEADLAQLARQARVEAQLLELQGEVRAVLRSLLEGQAQILRLLTTNGTGGHG